MLLTFSIENVCGSVESGTTYKTEASTSMPDGWSASAGNGSSYLKLLSSTHYIQTDNFTPKSITKIVVKARKFGGPADAQAKITISWYDASTKEEIVLGTISPSSTSLTDYTISGNTLKQPTANTTGYIKIQCKGASNSKGSGISAITITYEEGITKTAVSLIPILTNVSADENNKKEIEKSENSSVKLSYIADAGYVLPKNIVVKKGGATLTTSTDYMWGVDKSDNYHKGLLEIEPPFDDDIEVIITAAKESYTINNSLTNVTAVAGNVTTIQANDGNVQLKYTADGEYSLPDEISVTMEGGTLPSTAYDWTKKDGELIIRPDITLTGDIHVTITGLAPYNITEKVTNVTPASSNLKVVKRDAAGITLSYSVASGYILPDNINVTMGGNILIDDKDYTWDSTTGELMLITHFTGDIVVTIEALYAPKITTQPVGATYTEEDTPVALSIMADGNPEPTYQWFSNTANSTTGGAQLTGETESTYTPTTKTPGTMYYYCVVSNTVESVTSDIVAVVVNPLPEFTIQWSVNGVITETTSVKSGKTIGALPVDPIVPSSCSEKVFVGWSENNIGIDPTDNAPAYITTETAPKGNATYYAVFATQTEGATPTKFVVGDVGKYAIVAYVNDVPYALPTNPQVNSGKITASRITVSETNGVKYISTSDAKGFTWTIAKATNGYNIGDGTRYIHHSNGGSSGTNLTYGAGMLDDGTTCTWSFTADGDYIKIAAMKGATTNSRGMLFNGTTIGGYALSNWNSYNKTMILPICESTTYTEYITECTTSPMLNVVTDKLDFGDVETIGSEEQTFQIKGSNLTADVILSVSGTNADYFSVTPSTIVPQDGKVTNQTITVTYKPTETGEHSAILTITSTGAADKVISLSGSGKEHEYTITFDANGAKGTIQSIKQPKGTEITISDANSLMKFGFSFVGWKIGENMYAAGDKFIVPAEDVTFIAQWQEEYGVWQLVTTTEDITKGSYIIIAASSANVAMQSWSSGNNCKTVQVTKENDVLTYELTDAEGNPLSAPAIYEIQEGTQDGTYSFFDIETDQYIYAASSSSNYLKGQSNKDDNASWKISYNENNVVSVVAQGTYKNSTMQYNNSASAFSCYSSASQKPIALYKFIKGAYIISFDANGGDLGECPAKAVAKDGKLTISTTKPTFARDEQATEAKAFTSWNDKQDGNGNMYEAGKEYTFTVPTTLYAQWGTKPLHSVTYVAVGAAGTIPTDTKRYCEGEDVLLKAADNLSNVGYVFSGWKVTATDGTEVTVTNGTFTMPDADVIASAQWVRKPAGKYVLVTDKSQLVAGQQYVIACNTKGAVAGDIPDNKKYLSKVDAKFSQDKSRIYDIQGNAVLFTLGSTETEGSYTLACEEGQYLTISNGDVSWNTVATEWSIEINGVAIIKNGNNNCIKYNYSASPARFKTYGSSAQNVSAIQLYQFIPAVIISDYRDVSTSALMNGADVTIEDGGTLYYSAAEEYILGDIHVLEGGKLQLDGESKLTAQDFYINTTMGAGKSGQMIGATNSNFSVQGDAYIDITLGKNGDPNQWHAFTVPFPVDAMNGVYDLDNNKLTNEVNYAIMDYHGDIRAKGQYGWKKYRGILNPGTFYLMTVDGERTTYRFKKTGNGALVANVAMPLQKYAANGDGTGTDAGWNGVGNMTLAYGKANIDGITEVQVLNPETYTYEVKRIADIAFTVGTPFFVQAAADGVMTIEQKNGSRLYAPALQAAKTVSQYGVHFGNADYTDVLYISASEDATNTYQIGKDLVKMTMSDAPVVSQIFAEAYGNMLCVMYAPLSNNEAVFPLNLYAPKAGEYTISADEAQGETLYLMQGDNVVWNLTLGEYTLDLEQGANEGYSILLKAPHVTTDFNPVMDGNGELVEKVFLHNNLYIIRGGKMYDATGKMVSDK